MSQWHEVLGWYSPSPDAPPNENLSLIKKQIYLLWSHRIVKLLLGEYRNRSKSLASTISSFHVTVDKLKELSVGYEKVDFPNPNHISSNLFKRALELGTTKANNSTKNNKPWRKFAGDDTKQVVAVCSMYHAALNTLSQLKLDILSGRWNFCWIGKFWGEMRLVRVPLLMPPLFIVAVYSGSCRFLPTLEIFLE